MWSFNQHVIALRQDLLPHFRPSHAINFHWTYSRRVSPSTRTLLCFLLLPPSFTTTLWSIPPQIPGSGTPAQLPFPSITGVIGSCELSHHYIIMFKAYTVDGRTHNRYCKSAWILLLVYLTLSLYVSVKRRRPFSALQVKWGLSKSADFFLFLYNFTCVNWGLQMSIQRSLPVHNVSIEELRCGL